MNTTTNTSETMTDTQADAMVGLDAMESGNLAQAAKLLVGAGVTVEIGSDKYAGEILKVTRCTITVRYGFSGTERTFRKAPGARYWSSKGCYYLSFGEATTELDLCH